MGTVQEGCEGIPENAEKIPIVLVHCRGMTNFTGVINNLYRYEREDKNDAER